MEAKAKVTFVRIGPRKVRPVIDLIRNKHIDSAFDILGSVNKKGARLTEDLLKSAVANAKVKKMNEEELFISDIRADGGPTMKRYMSRSMGRADRILKRTSHLSVILTEKKREQQETATSDSQQESSVATKKTKKKKSSKKLATSKK